MNIKIKKIAVENYKCFQQERAFDFFHKTKISGRNRSGKSTIRDSYFDVLTGKMADGSQPDKIRPHDKNGTDVDKVDIIREINIEIDKKPVVIQKRTFQKWRKPRGQAEEVFDGNGVDYKVDDFSYKPEKYKDYISRMVKQDTLLMCSNPNIFLNTLQSSTSEARKLLENAAGFSVERFISENPQYAHIEEITKGHSVEDTTKKLKKQLSEQKKKMEAQNTKIKYEKTRGSDKSKVEVSDLELAKCEWKEKLLEIDKQEDSLNKSSKDYDDLLAEIRELKQQREVIIRSANKENNDNRNEIEEKIAELNQKKKMLSSELSQSELDLRQIEMSMQRHEAELKKSRTEYIDYSGREFDESKLHEIECEQFNEDSLICPTCGQPFPADKQSEMREQFDKSKKQRISEQEKIRKEFNESLELRLTSIIDSGNKANQDLEDDKKKKGDVEQKINHLKKDISSVAFDIENLMLELKRIPESVDLSENKEYLEIQEQISRKEKSLSFLSNGSEQRKEIREKRNSCMQEISNIDSTIKKINADEEEKERNLVKLESDLRIMSQAAADLERQIDAVSDFSRAKNKTLAETVNPHFRHFQFSFLEHTIEGNPVETCKIMCEGTDFFKGLNGGDRKLCEIDLCRGLQELNGLCLPIWVDEANTIDPWRIPQDLEQQLILISRDDGDLKVEEMK